MLLGKRTTLVVFGLRSHLSTGQATNPPRFWPGRGNTFRGTLFRGGIGVVCEVGTLSLANAG